MWTDQFRNDWFPWFGDSDHLADPLPHMSVLSLLCLFQEICPHQVCSVAETFVEIQQVAGVLTLNAKWIKQGTRKSKRGASTKQMKGVHPNTLK
jgi:hypothetical protein